MPMLTWNGRHGDYVRLEIMGYQFPDASDDHDANWICVGIEARNEQGEWKCQASCMVTQELRWFAQWLSKVVDGVVENSISAYEFDLKLHYLTLSEGIHRFAVCLSYGLGYVSPTSENNASLIVVGLDDTELREAIGYFQDAEHRYPRRGRLSEQPPYDLPEIELPF